MKLHSASTNKASTAYVAEIELTDEERAFNERIQANSDELALAMAIDIANNCGENARVMSLRERNTQRYVSLASIQNDPVMPSEEPIQDNEGYIPCNCEDYPCCGH